VLVPVGYCFLVVAFFSVLLNIIYDDLDEIIEVDDKDLE